MSLEDSLHYEVQGYILFPSELFSKILASQPPDERMTVEMKRFGILTENLHRFDATLVVNHRPPISNANIRVSPDRSNRLETPDEIKRFRDSIEKSALDETNEILINYREFSEATVNSVYWLLNQLQDEFSTRRKTAIGQYCRKTGLFDVDPPERDSKDISENDGWTIPDVSKL